MILIIVKNYGREAFEFLDGFIKVTIPFDKEVMEYMPNGGQGDPQNDPQNDPQKTMEEKIIELIKKNNKITRIKMAEILGVSEPTIKRAIKASIKIKYFDPSKGGHWKVKD